MFAHIVVFISFIYAIAITHPLTSIHELIVERRRVRWSALLLCWMASGVLLLLMNWLIIFRLSTVTNWSTGQILVHILAAICIYYTCSLPAIRAHENKPIDMPGYYARNRVPILGAFLLFGMAAILVNLVDAHAEGQTASATLDRLYRLLPNTAAEAVGLTVRTTWVQWAVALFVLGRLAYLMVLRIVVS